MKRMAVDQLKTGMTVARNVFMSTGELLIGAGTELNEKHIQRLNESCFLSVYIVSENDDRINLSEEYDVISEDLRVETVRTVQEAFVEAAHQSSLDLGKAQKCVHSILQAILASDDLLVNLVDIRSLHEYVFGHSANVCVLAIMTGITLGYAENRLKELGIGALLHDMGHTMIPQALLHKPGPLLPGEMDEIRKHPVYGFNVLRKQTEVSLLSAHVAFQHHERWDGTGYPRKLGKRDIHDYARIVAVADVFDALMSDRPYRPGYNTPQTIKIMRGLAGNHLDPIYTEALLANVATYPLGSLVELNNGSIAMIIGTNRHYPSRPTVQLIYDSCRKSIKRRHNVDLSSYTTVFIRRVLSDKECHELLTGCPC